jgi:hypothetical protein
MPEAQRTKTLQQERVRSTLRVWKDRKRQISQGMQRRERCLELTRGYVAKDEDGDENAKSAEGCKGRKDRRSPTLSPIGHSMGFHSPPAFGAESTFMLRACSKRGTPC